MVMNWSYFKPEFSCKPEEDPKAYILRTINWMDTHNFATDHGVQSLPVTLVSETRLWYQSIDPFQSNLDKLKEIFRNQSSKID